MTPGRSMKAASSHQKHPPAKMAVARPGAGACAAARTTLNKRPNPNAPSSLKGSSPSPSKPGRAGFDSARTGSFWIEVVSNPNAGIVRNSLETPAGPAEGAMRFQTRAVHAGRKPDPATGTLAPPIHLSTTFEHGPAGARPPGDMY